MEKTDGYKPSQWKQVEQGITETFGYVESRGGLYPETVFFGLQGFIMDNLTKPISFSDVDRAKKFYDMYFNRTDVFNYVVGIISLGNMVVTYQ